MFDALKEARATSFIMKQSWSYDEFNEQKMLEETIKYLDAIEPLLRTEDRYPQYVVHCQEDDTRFVTPSHTSALKVFKAFQKDKKRAAVFHWLHKYKQEKLYASDGYAFDRDYGRQK